MVAWLGTISSIIGSFLVALGFLNTGYILFLIGALSWLVVGFNKRDKPLFVLNSVYLVANIIGLVNYW